MQCGLRCETSDHHDIVQMRDTERQLSRLNQDMIRLNTLISKNQESASDLENETFNMQRSVVCELKELEGKAAGLERDIDVAAQAKKQALSDVLETERQIMLWERKIQLEKEMQDILDPTVGNVRSAAVSFRLCHATCERAATL